jgi:serine/threonine protein kinase
MLSPSLQQKMCAQHFENHRGRNRALSAKFSSICPQQMLLGLAYMHSHGIVHASFALDHIMLPILDNQNIRAAQHPKRLRMEPRSRVDHNSYPDHLYANAPMMHGISRFTKCKIGGLGSSFLENPGMTVNRMAMASLRLPPEVVILCHRSGLPGYDLMNRELLKAHVDLFAFGITMYELLTWKRMFAEFQPMSTEDLHKRLMVY